MSGHDPELRRVEDELKVTCWRAERLQALGYHPREATLLALSGIDVHEVESLIGQGCPAETAARIAA